MVHRYIYKQVELKLLRCVWLHLLDQHWQANTWTILCTNISYVEVSNFFYNYRIVMLKRISPENIVTKNGIYFYEWIGSSETKSALWWATWNELGKTARGNWIYLEDVVWFEAAANGGNSISEKKESAQVYLSDKISYSLKNCLNISIS